MKLFPDTLAAVYGNSPVPKSIFMSLAEAPSKLPVIVTLSAHLYLVYEGAVIDGCLAASYVNVQVEPVAQELSSSNLPATTTGLVSDQVLSLGGMEQVIELGVEAVSTEMILHRLLMPDYPSCKLPR